VGKRTIVTGATGFVGANLVRRLLHDSHEVHVLVRRSRSEWRIAEIAREIQVHETDLTDREQVRRTVNAVRPDWLLHLAAYGAYTQQADADQIVHTNINGSMALMDACAEAGVEAFVQTGSSSEYGWKDHAPHEDERVEPNSVYAISKAASTHYCQMLARMRDLNAITLRLYSIYGPYEEPTRLVPTILIYGNRGGLPPLVSPKTARDYVYVEDAVDAIMHVAGAAGIPRGSVYNLCTGIQTELATLVAHARELLKIPAVPVWGTMPPRPWDTDVWVGDPSTMENETGWRATTSLREGLERTLQWLRGSPGQLAFYERQILRRNRY